MIPIFLFYKIKYLEFLSIIDPRINPIIDSSLQLPAPYFKIKNLYNFIYFSIYHEYNRTFSSLLHEKITLSSYWSNNKSFLKKNFSEDDNGDIKISSSVIFTSWLKYE